MLDLNLIIAHQDEKTNFRSEVEESGTSNSSVMNAEGCNSNNVGEGDDDSVSATGDGDSFHCFNFDILKVGDTGALLSNSNSNDDGRTSQTQAQTQAEFVTRPLFPMNQGGGSFNQGQPMNSLMLFPNNIPVQHQKPIVQQNQVAKKSRRGPRSRSSQYRGVTFYRRTGRWESHIWDCGKQVYLGGFDTAHSAARAYDRAAIKFRGVDADINFNLSDYEDDMNQQIGNLSKEEFVHLLRRHSNGFSRGNSKYRGITMNKFGKSETFPASLSGNDHNLDLNLGISTPSSIRKGNLEHMEINHGLHAIGRLKTDNHGTTALKGLPVISDHRQPWSGMYPTFIPNHQGPTKWAWRLHGQSQIPTTILTAASSGFPAPAAANSLDYFHQIRQPPSPPPAPPPTP